MRKKIFYLIILMMLCCGLFAFINDAYSGEEITYKVEMGIMSLGRCVLKHLRAEEVNGIKANVLLFQTDLVNFHDTERIYLDQESSLPVRVTRKISGFSDEQITEDYNQKDFTVTISKKTKDQVTTSVLKRTAPVHNPIALPFYLRSIKELSPAWQFTACLPLMDFTLKLTGIEKIRVPAGTFQAYRFESVPRKIKIWITTDKLRIPVKIVGSGVFGYTMLMLSYKDSREK
ncbi:MAG: DUF3108 domain-containing protein [Candidatus Omnitrophica bacterium]|jgi:hypothetical protein|nr:DUF3108 domain-containing protein [Candidatus Omnitrophota bacterium]